ncbi:MAG: DUF547 domain-containing protein [Alphaproteobacteria bacterium]|nr:DUF547 domain-containing protein [Alphaproteobacteria bacterium]
MRIMIKAAGLAAMLAAGVPTLAYAQDASPVRAAPVDQRFDQFVPRETASTTRLDYGFWDEALSFFVLRMGRSTRQGASRPDPTIGTRRVYGHDSRYRLEGNRVLFDLVDDEAFTPLTEYRADLERIATEIDIAQLPRNEQLAFWLNLHNVAMVEQIAANYPVASPGKILLGDAKTPLDTTPFITIRGVSMSLRDIRTKIVYPNWSDPRVFYGFFRGDIGGPSIRREAFTGQNVAQELNDSADEFVNSLRGVEAYGGSLRVSALYEEIAPFYFPNWNRDLHAHLAVYADDEVAELLGKYDTIELNQYNSDIADLAKGEREPSYNYVEPTGDSVGIALSSSIRRLLQEREQKMEELRKDGRNFQIILLPTGQTPSEAASSEVD